MRTLFLAGLSMPVALAAPMQLNHQGRVLDSSGDPFQGTHTVLFEIVDGADTVRFSESFANIELNDGYFGVALGGGSTMLDTSVFLDHGAMFLDITVDGSEVLGGQPLGGYPVVVAQQSLLATQASVDTLATQASVDALATSTGLYSETCSDFAARGWASESDCLHDGRWHLVYDQGAGTGSLPNLRAYVMQGADVRVVSPTVNPAAFDCQGISFLDRTWGNSTAGMVCHSTQTSHPGPHNQNVGQAYWSVYDLWSSGQIYYTERTGTGGTFTNIWHSNASGKWYVSW